MTHFMAVTNRLQYNCAYRLIIGDFYIYHNHSICSR